MREPDHALTKASGAATTATANTAIAMMTEIGRAGAVYGGTIVRAAALVIAAIPTTRAAIWVRSGIENRDMSCRAPSMSACKREACHARLATRPDARIIRPCRLSAVTRRT